MKRFFIRTRLTNFAFLLSLLGAGIAGVHCSGGGGGSAGIGAGGGAIGPIETPLTTPQGALSPDGIRTGVGDQNPQDQKKVPFRISVSTPTPNEKSNCGRTILEFENLFPEGENSPLVRTQCGVPKEESVDKIDHFINSKDPILQMGSKGSVRFDPQCSPFINIPLPGKAFNFVTVTTVRIIVTWIDGPKFFQSEFKDLASNAKPQDPPPEICLTLTEVESETFIGNAPPPLKPHPQR